MQFTIEQNMVMWFETVISYLNLQALDLINQALTLAIAGTLSTSIAASSSALF